MNQTTLRRDHVGYSIHPTYPTGWVLRRLYMIGDSAYGAEDISAHITYLGARFAAWRHDRRHAKAAR